MSSRRVTIEVSDEDSSKELFESTILEDEDLDEDHPPLEAVQGYRPDDTQSSQIYVGYIYVTQPQWKASGMRV